MKRVLVFLSVIAMAALALTAPPSLAGVGAGPQVALFYDGDYMRIDPEADQVRAGLDGAGATVTLIEDITADDWAAGLDGADVLVLPELAGDDDLGNDLSAAAIDVIRSWVEAGGRIVFFGSDPPWGSVNIILGTSFQYTADYSSVCSPSGGPDPLACELTPDGAGTEFGDGPASLEYLDDTSNAPTGGFPAGTQVIYEDATTGAPGVFVSPIGNGALVFFAFDWYESEEPALQALWNEALAESLAVGASVNDVSVNEGTPAQFTITLDETPSQDVVITYRTVDGTATAGVDYEPQDSVLVIPAGTNSALLGVPTIVRPGEQGSRQFSLEIDAPYWGLTVDPIGTATISDPATTTTTTAPAARVTPRFTG